MSTAELVIKVGDKVMAASIVPMLGDPVLKIATGKEIPKLLVKGAGNAAELAYWTRTGASVVAGTLTPVGWVMAGAFLVYGIEDQIDKHLTSIIEKRDKQLANQEILKKSAEGLNKSLHKFHQENNLIKVAELMREKGKLQELTKVRRIKG